MKLHAKDGSVTIDTHELLPAIPGVEWELEENDIKRTLTPGKKDKRYTGGHREYYLTIEAPVYVTRVYKVTPKQL